MLTTQDGTRIDQRGASHAPAVTYNPRLGAFVPAIPPRQYRLYADLILSGDIADHRVPEILESDPAFARWYRDLRGLPEPGRAA